MFVMAAGLLLALWGTYIETNSQLGRVASHRHPGQKENDLFHLFLPDSS